MKKALILGTNAGQADIINYLKKNNWNVHVCGYKAEGPGVKLAHQFHLVNTLDETAVTKLATEIKADIVYSVSSDSAIKTATKVSENLKLPILIDSNIIDLFHYKDRLRKFLNETKINEVGFAQVDNANAIKNWNLFPCVVKPTDSQGQRGVVLIHKKEDLFEAVQFAINQSRSKSAIVEEFLNGTEFSSNIILQNGKLIVNEFTERLVFSEPEFFGLPQGHCIPMINVSDDLISKSTIIIEKIIKELDLKNAVLYIQMKDTVKGPKIIEIAPRLDGCHIWRLLRAAKGYDLREFAIKALTGKVIKKNNINTKEQESFTLKFYHQKTNDLFNRNLFKSVKNPIYNEFRYANGEKVLPINGSLEVVGYYIIKK